jgi:hypothetical protein
LAPWDFWQPAKTNVDKNAFWGREHFGPSYFSHVGPSGAFKWYQPDQNLLTMCALSATNCWANCTARMICLCPVLCTPWRRTFDALFCYRRSHLHSIGLAIAASCDKDSLVWAGGSVGAFVFACSREASPREVQSARADRRKITLATGVLRMFADDDDMALDAPTDPLPLVEMASSQA